MKRYTRKMISIGKGSYGKVFLDEENSVAIKETYFDDFNITHDILKEVDTLRRFSHHPNIILLQKIKVYKNKIWLIMDYGGNTLFKYIRDADRETRLNNCVPIFSQIISGLHFLHAHKVMHRDLKPENILLDENLKVKICDFGLSKVSSIKKNTPKVCSLYYRPPECLLKVSQYNEKIDIWSLGCMFYEYVAQHVAFKGKSRKEMVNRIFSVFPWHNYYSKTFQCNRKEYNFTFKEDKKQQFIRRLPKNFRKFLVYILQVDPQLRPSIRHICNSDLFNKKCKIYHVKENKASEIVDYLSKLSKVEDLIQQRKSIVKFIFDLSKDKKYQPETPFLAIDLMDRYLSKNIKHIKYTLDEIAVGCLRIASKYIEVDYSYFHSLAPNGEVDDFEYKINQVEKEILNKLKWIIYRKTVYEILKDKHGRSQSPNKMAKTLETAKKIVYNYDFVKSKYEVIEEALQ